MHTSPAQTVLKYIYLDIDNENQNNPVEDENILKFRKQAPDPNT